MDMTKTIRDRRDIALLAYRYQHEADLARIAVLRAKIKDLEKRLESQKGVEQ